MNENMNTSNFRPYQPLPKTAMEIAQMNQTTGLANTTPPLMPSQMPMQMPNEDALTDDILPETLTNPLYTPGFLRTQIGKLMRVEFLIGDSMTDRVGRLIQVGASFILLQSIDPLSVFMCDLYSIKFVSIVTVGEGNPIWP